MHTVASTATRAELERVPNCRQFMERGCPRRERASFLLGGLNVVMEQATQAEV